MLRNRVSVNLLGAGTDSHRSLRLSLILPQAGQAALNGCGGVGGAGRFLRTRRNTTDEPWQTTIQGDGVVHLDPPGVNLPVARIYRRTSLAAA